MRVVASSSIVLSSLLASSAWCEAQTAQAQAAAGVSLVWDAPAACPGVEAVHNRIRAVAGDAGSEAAPVEAEAIVRQDADGLWRLTLVTKQGEVRGKRAFEADSCLAVTEAAALVIAMMRDPNAHLDAQPTPAPAAKPNERRAPPQPPPDRGPSRSKQAPEKRWAVQVSPMMVLDWGSLPSVTPGAGGMWSVTSSSVQLDFYGVWFPPRRAAIANRAGVGAEVGLVAAGGRGCVRHLAERYLIGACGGGEVGSLSVDAYGVSRTQRAHPFWGAVLGVGEAAWRLAPSIALWLEAGAAVPLTRPQIVVRPYGEAFQPAWVAGRAAAGVSYSF